MTQPRRLSPDARERAFRRLRRLTISTVVGAFAATVGLGTLAAATYSGTSKTTAPTPSGAPAAQPSANTAPQPTDPSAPTSDPNSPGSGSLQPTPQPPASGSSGSGHATTGGSR
ncbi:MAG: hypothetical protein JF888_02275 [Candidatus Dormibacteraeota bacterium]|uniref:Uncharacterized protein n=1 Tax=Candidatus Dormiibacter inghamiae TaxID=3127013 RepID=A0A934NGE0_9BACT|nr:hypothetical protein [Candidatus Dormibacteraeota bacterium]MBJ7605410.1 hypothetical protein [Candidatus Dormibacteraeota bacterium]